MGVAPRPYQAQVAPGGTAADLGTISPDALGAGTGRALQQLGAAGEQYAYARMQVQRNEDWSNWSLQFEDAKEKAEADALNRRTGAGDTAQPGWAGHADMVAGETRQRMDQLLAQLKDPGLLRQATARVNAFTNDLVGREREFEAGKRIAKMGQDTKEIAQRAGSRLLNSDAIFTDLPAVLHDFDGFIDNLEVAPDIKEGLRRELVPGLLDAGVQNRINAGDLDAAEKMIKAPAFADLGADRSQALLNEIGVERRRREAAARAEQATALSRQKEQLATQRTMLDTGAGKPADWEGLAQGYEAVGDTSAAAEARAKGVQMAAVQGSRDYTLPQMQAEIARLDAKERGATGLTPAEASLRTGLRDQLSQSQARLNRTGGALEQYQYATGKPLPPIDPNNPASLQARASYAAIAAAKYGRPTVEPLMESELAGLRQQMEGGPGEKMGVLQVLAGFGDPRAIEGAARQLSTSKEDGSFRIAATYLTGPGGRQIARDILNGPKALAAHPQLVDRRQASAIFDEFAPALLGLGSEFAADTREAAIALYASRMSAQGLTGWSPAEFRNAVDAAMGGVHDGPHYKGGTWTFKGQRVAIPQGWTAEGVFRRIARMSGKEAASAQVSGNGRWPDGSPVYTGQLREMIPVYLGGTRYGFRSPNGSRLLPDDRGGVYTLDVAKVPWR